MRHTKTLLICLSLLLTSAISHAFVTDIISTASGDLAISTINHSSLRFEFKGQVIYVDPVLRYANYSNQPKADIILVTHEHYDHCDKEAIKLLSKDGTINIITKAIAKQGIKGITMNNGDQKKINGLTIEAVPAYNKVHRREDGSLFHTKNVGNGYVITFANKRVYVAGDTENIIEMKSLDSIAVAFLPMNLPFTMTPEMVADAVICFEPKILYPYHFGDTDTSELIDILKEYKQIDIRMRDMP